MGDSQITTQDRSKQPVLKSAMSAKIHDIELSELDKMISQELIDMVARAVDIKASICKKALLGVECKCNRRHDMMSKTLELALLAAGRELIGEKTFIFPATAKLVEMFREKHPRFKDKTRTEINEALAKAGIAHLPLVDKSKRNTRFKDGGTGDKASNYRASGNKETSITIKLESGYDLDISTSRVKRWCTNLKPVAEVWLNGNGEAHRQDCSHCLFHPKGESSCVCGNTRRSKDGKMMIYKDCGQGTCIIVQSLRDKKMQPIFKEHLSNSVAEQMIKDLTSQDRLGKLPSTAVAGAMRAGDATAADATTSTNPVDGMMLSPLYTQVQGVQRGTDSLKDAIVAQVISQLQHSETGSDTSSIGNGSASTVYTAGSFGGGIPASISDSYPIGGDYRTYGARSMTREQQLQEQLFQISQELEMLRHTSRAAVQAPMLPIPPTVQPSTTPPTLPHVRPGFYRGPGGRGGGRGGHLANQIRNSKGPKPDGAPQQN